MPGVSQGPHQLPPPASGTKILFPGSPRLSLCLPPLCPWDGGFFSGGQQGPTESGLSSPQGPGGKRGGCVGRQAQKGHGDLNCKPGRLSVVSAAIC